MRKEQSSGLVSLMIVLALVILLIWAFLQPRLKVAAASFESGVESVLSAH